jgi:hypothetical protein
MVMICSSSSELEIPVLRANFSSTSDQLIDETDLSLLVDLLHDRWRIVLIKRWVTEVGMNGVPTIARHSGGEIIFTFDRNW